MAFWNPKESSAVLPTPFEEIYLAQKYVKQLDTSPWLPLENLRFWKWPQLWSQIGWLAMGPALRLAPKSQTLYSLRPLWPHLSHTQRWFYRCHAFLHPHPPDNPRVPQYLINQPVRFPRSHSRHCWWKLFFNPCNTRRVLVCVSCAATTKMEIIPFPHQLGRSSGSQGSIYHK
jgi:hypothetical protein